MELLGKEVKELFAVNAVEQAKGGGQLVVNGVEVWRLSPVFTQVKPRHIMMTRTGKTSSKFVPFIFVDLGGFKHLYWQDKRAWLH